MRVAIVVSTVGFHWEELFSAFDELERAGAAIDVFTVDGAAPRPDPMSLKHTGPLALMGIGVPARIDPDTPRGRHVQRALDARLPLRDMSPPGYDGLYLPGGHGCLFDVNRNELLHERIRDLYVAGKVLSAVCHATSTFAFVRSAGRSIAAGKELTGFPQAMDDLLIRTRGVHEEYLPLPFSNERVLRREGVKLPTLDPLRGALNPRHMCVSLPFITGVGPKSARPVARAVVAAVREKRIETRARVAA